jgi:glycosyltransferase involved in cell wall biosynthesis
VPAISVLMPVYNSEESLHKAIESIRNQTFTDWELVIVDDASTDATASIAEEKASADARIRVIRNRENKGLPACLNLAFTKSSGMLIARMDADDCSLETRFAVQYDFLCQRPSIDVLGTAAWIVDFNDARTGISRRRETHDEIVAAIYRENPFIHPSVMMRRRFLETLGGYNESFRRGQDHDLWLRGYRNFRYHNLQAPLLEYRQPVRMTWAGCASAVRAVSAAGIRDRAPLRAIFYAVRVVVAFMVSDLFRHGTPT